MNDTKSAHDLDSPHCRLRTARIRAGFRSAEKAAEHLKVLPSTYRSHENGFRKFFLETANSYALAFNVSSDYLMYGAKLNQDRERDASSRETLVAVMTEGVRVSRLTDLSPEYLADMIVEALEAYEEDTAAHDPKEFARIYLGTLKRRSAAQ